MLYLIVGKSGSGKDFMVDKLCKEFVLNKVISRTTREPRNNEIGTHIFVTNEQADKEWKDSIARTIFNGNRYYTLKKDIEGKDFYIIDPNGVDSMKKSGIEYKSIYIKSPWYVRAYHMRKRRDRVIDIIKRLWHDRKAFKGFTGDINLKSSNELYSYIKGEIKEWKI